MEGTERGLRGYLGLGSNVGDRLANLRAAVDALSRHVDIVGKSSVYETEPQGEVLDQPDFLNAAVAIETSLGPEELLDVCKVIEGELGRDFGEVRHGPRVVDIDVLLLGAIELQTDRLTLPHREVATRRFVLVPLLELDPDLPYRDALARLEGQRVQRVGVL
ncbi:MAG: 2-amino-4-hydroxy-6-hydroxymethyldihydropteridine diphosphokinase [Thermoleophilaceae bacterium]|nr:2-amino-4-hydroxy-6-hydroxymethyldihydropteridine diphosphokinase [Thermoleophilaceae bacterium]